MPNRLLADVVCVTLRVIAVVYFVVQVILTYLHLLSGTLDIGGSITALAISLILFGLGTVIDILLSIERRLFGLNNS